MPAVHRSTVFYPYATNPKGYLTTNIYTSDGTLSGNRSVTVNDKSFHFDGTTPNWFSSFTNAGQSSSITVSAPANQLATTQGTKTGVVKTYHNLSSVSACDNAVTGSEVFT